jgi:nucleotide-binding universal stress UspA family protein
LGPFRRILVALDHSRADSVLLGWVKQLARLSQAEIVLLHVSTGWAAQWQGSLDLSDSQEMREDRAYLAQVEKQLQEEGFRVTSRHASGKPADRILETARAEQCDLIAMASHGHRLLSDLIYGATITKVRHESEVPIFLVRGPAGGAPSEGG